jgi:hypothetical protein
MICLRHCSYPDCIHETASRQSRHLHEHCSEQWYPSAAVAHTNQVPCFILVALPPAQSRPRCATGAAAPRANCADQSDTVPASSDAPSPMAPDAAALVSAQLQQFSPERNVNAQIMEEAAFSTRRSWACCVTLWARRSTPRRVIVGLGQQRACSTHFTRFRLLPNFTRISA